MTPEEKLKAIEEYVLNVSRSCSEVIDGNQNEDDDWDRELNEDEFESLNIIEGMLNVADEVLRILNK